MFAYCTNNPINMIDRTGGWPKWLSSAVESITCAVKKVISAVTNVVKSLVPTNSVPNIVVANARSLPKTGEPDSSQTLPNPDGTPKQKRWYGPDGNAERDRDYNHDGDHPFPHDHEWKDGKRQKEHLPPSPDYEFSLEPVIGIGVVTVCSVGMIIIAVDDLTGVGVANNFLYGPLGAMFSKGLTMISG